MKTIGELHDDTKKLEGVLGAVAIGDVITYETLSAAIGHDVRRRRHLLATARRRLLRDGQILFEAVTNVGMKRLSDAGKIATGRQHLRKARRQGKFAIAKTSAVDDFNALSPELKSQHHANLALGGVLVHMSSPQIVKRLTAQISTATKSLLMHEALEAMKPLL